MRATWIVLICLLVATCIKHALTLSTGPTILEYDSLDYWERGGFIAHGDWWQQQRAVNYRGPLYPLFLGICQLWFGSYALLTVALLQHAAQITAGLMVPYICWRVCRRRSVVLVAYALSALSITGPWYANVVLTESLFQLAMTVTLGAIVVYHTQPSRSNAAGCGAALGLATLTRPIPKLLWLPLAVVWLLASIPRREFRRTLWHIALLCTAMVAVMAPWSLRNRIMFENSSVAKVPPINKWVVCFHAGSAADLPIPSSVAGNELRRLLPDIDYNHELRRDGYEVLQRLQAANLSASQIDQLTTRVCLDGIAANPTTFLWKTFKRFVNFWRCPVNQYPYYSTYDALGLPAVAGQYNWRWEPLASWYESLLRRSPSIYLRWMELDTLACALGTLLLILRPPSRMIGLSIAVIFLYFAAITAALEVESYRYRMVLDPCIIVAGVCGLMGGLGRAADAELESSSDSATIKATSR